MTIEEALIERLEPSTRERYRQYRDELAAVGIQERAIVTMRTLAAQARKVSSGRSTQAIGWHQLGRAIDRQLKDGDKWDADAKNVELYLRAARIAERSGFRQIGFNRDGTKRYLETKDGKKFWDPFHIEFRGDFSSLAAAVRKEAPQWVRYLA